jgi:hypothetical protein
VPRSRVSGIFLALSVPPRGIVLMVTDLDQDVTGDME